MLLSREFQRLPDDIVFNSAHSLVSSLDGRTYANAFRIQGQDNMFIVILMNADDNAWYTLVPGIPSQEELDRLVQCNSQEKTTDPLKPALELVKR